MTATRSQSVPRTASGNHCRIARILATSDSSCPDLGTKLWTKLLSILPVGVTICDGRGVCIYKNAKALEYFPDDGFRQGVDEFVDSAEAFMKTSAVGGCYQCVYLHHRRGRRSLHSTATAIVDDKTGECVSLFVHADDARPAVITELKVKGGSGLVFPPQEHAGDADGIKASYDTPKAYAKLQDYDVFARHSSYHRGALDEHKAAYCKLRGATGKAQEGPDGLGLAHQHLCEGSTSTKSSPDTQIASFDQLQVDEEVEELPHSDVYGLDSITPQPSCNPVERAPSLGAHYADYTRLQETNAALQAELDFHIQRRSKGIIDSGTPADKILHMMTELIQGSTPSTANILFIQTAILEGHNIYAPVNVKQQIMQSDRLEEDVSRSLVARLGDDSEDRGHFDAVLLEEMHSGSPPEQSSSPTKRGAAGNFRSLASVAEWLMAPEDEPGTQQQGATLAGSPVAVSVSPARPLFSMVEDALATVNNWEFDAFHLADITQNNPLSVLGFYLFHESHFISSYKLDAAALARFLRAIEAGYNRHAHPYHNATHAADVLQTFHMLLHQGGLVPGYADQLTVMACYTAAIVHDFEHRGVTNDYLISSGHDLSILYNDHSPLENHHAAAAFNLLRRPEYNFLAALSRSDQARFRKLVIDLVLATDMKQHFHFKSQFTTVHSLPAPITSPSALCTEPNRSRGSSTTGSTDSVAGPMDEHERLLSLQVALKCADIGHLAASLEVHKRWVQNLEEEFFQQGDEEKRHDLPVSALFDREKPGITKSQVGFFDVVAIPLFHNYTRVFRGAKPLFANVLQNYNHWAALQREAASTRPGSEPG